MWRLVLGRIAQATLVVVLVVTACFVVIRLAPGDPFAQQIESEGVGADLRAQLRTTFGYDRPIPEQFVRYVGSALRGEFGWSHSRSAPVREVLARTLPKTLLLMGAAFVLSLLVGVLLGAWQGWSPGSTLARATDRLGLVLLSVPEFVLALLLLLVLALGLGLFPVGGMRSLVPPHDLLGATWDRLRHLALPLLSLTLVQAAVVARHQRAAMQGLREARFITAARARGLSERRIFWRHALRNSLVPVLTLTGLLLPGLVGGAVLVERIFAWPGMGSALVDAVVSRDYHLVVGGVLVGSTGVVIGTLFADLALLWADPRRRVL